MSERIYLDYNATAPAEPEVVDAVVVQKPDALGRLIHGGGQERGLRAGTENVAGIAISAGSACSAGKVEPPYVLTAMGVPDGVAVTAVRVSLGWRTRAEDIDRFVAAWRELYERAGARAG